MKENSVAAIIEKYEIPAEYHEALWAAYRLGSTKGFLTAVKGN